MPIKKNNLDPGHFYGAVHLCTTNFVQIPIHWQNFLNFTLLQGARFYSEKYTHENECEQQILAFLAPIYTNFKA